MIKYGTVLLLFILMALISCQKEHEETTTLGFEKDLIPEGIAIDPVTRTVFLNSLKKNKIVLCSLDGSHPSNFIEPNEHGYLSGFGMTIKGDTLFALGNSLPKENNRSILLLLNIRTGTLINSYSINDSSLIYLNDIAVDADHNMFITDSESNTIYTVQNQKKKLEVFMEMDGIAHSNGITISNNGKYLYLASFQNGIRVVDIATKKTLNEANSFLGIDGLKFYKNSLIGIVNARRKREKNGVFRYYLNEEKTAITHHKKIIPFKENFKVPTTFDILNDSIHFIINSQLDNFNQESNGILDVSLLEPYQLLKKKIE